MKYRLIATVLVIVALAAAVVLSEQSTTAAPMASPSVPSDDLKSFKLP